MPIIKNAKKALRSSKRKAGVNQLLRAKTRTSVKQSRLEPTLDSIKTAFSNLDKSVKKKLMHKNKAARLKSALSKLSLNTEKQSSVSVKKTAAKTVKKSSSSSAVKKSAVKTKVDSKSNSVKTPKKTISTNKKSSTGSAKKTTTKKTK